MSDCRKCADFDWCAENEDCGLFKPKPQTNADRIRGMSDEELAIICKDGCPPNQGCFPSVECYKIGEESICQRCWLNWLKSSMEGREVDNT